MVHLVPPSECTWIHSRHKHVGEKCRESHSDDLSFPFHCPHPTPTSPSLTTDYLSTKQRWHQSGRPIARSYPQSTTSESKQRAKSERQNLLRSLRLPTVVVLNASYDSWIPREILPTAFFFYKILKRKKKKPQTNKQTDRLLPPVRWLTTPDTCFGEDYFLFGGMIADACSCK